MKKNGISKTKKIMIAIVLVIIGITLYFIFRSKKEDEISDLPLPYI